MAEASGVNKAESQALMARYAGRSLRAGLATSAAEANVPGDRIRFGSSVPDDQFLIENRHPIERRRFKSARLLGHDQ